MSANENDEDTFFNYDTMLETSDYKRTNSFEGLLNKS